MKLRIGSRESRLAVIQSQLVMDQLKQDHPGLETRLVTMKTTGDRILDKTLDKVGGKGLFVKELDLALSRGEVDVTVHSLKDLPMEVHPDLPVVAYTRREDPRDVLVLPLGKTEMERGKPIGCSSHRRRLQLAALYPEWQVMPVRGNVQTRLEKLDRGEYAALVLAAAGLHRLGLQQRIARYFTVEEMLPAAGQGIMAVQTRGDLDKSLFRGVNDPQAEVCALAERSFVRALGGGCSSPVAAYGQIRGEELLLTGLYVNREQTIVRRGTITGSPEQAEALGLSLARRLKEGDS